MRKPARELSDEPLDAASSYDNTGPLDVHNLLSSSRPARARHCHSRNYLFVMIQAPTSRCPHCDEPMRLVRIIPPLEPAWPSLLAFYCAPCSHAETKEERAV
jgi:hypothetical protein